MWIDTSPGGEGAKLSFPTPAMVMANFGKWFPDLKDSTRAQIELLYGGRSYLNPNPNPNPNPDPNLNPNPYPGPDLSPNPNPKPNPHQVAAPIPSRAPCTTRSATTSTSSGC